MIKIKNTGATSSWEGMEIQANGEYTLENEKERIRWASNDVVYADIASGRLVVNDGLADLTALQGWNFLAKNDVKISNAIHNSGIAEPDGHRARLKGMCKETITAGQTLDCDYPMEQLQYQGTNRETVFDGVEYYAKNADNFDEITFQVVDKDGFGVLAGWYDQATFDAMGNLYVVEEFGDTVFCMPDAHVLLRFYRSKIVPGLYIRAKYKSTGTTDVKFSMNLIRHLVE
jgi:hypothetical protein